MIKQKYFIFVIFLSIFLSSQAFAKTGSFESKDGSHMIYSDLGKGDTTLLFIHCWSCNRNYWKNQKEVFEKDYRLILIDLPGHGESHAGKELQTTIVGMAKDVAELIDRLNLKNVILVGSSMGGPISLEVARLQPKRVIGIVGVDNLHNVEIHFPREMLQTMLTALEKDYGQAAKDFIPTMFASKADPQVVQWTVKEAARSCDPTVCLPLLTSLSNLDLKKMMKESKVPIRNINAAPYSQTSQKTNVEVNRKYGDFDAIEMQEVGHFIMLEKPAEFNANLKKQIQAILGAKGQSHSASGGTPRHEP